MKERNFRVIKTKSITPIVQDIAEALTINIKNQLAHYPEYLERTLKGVCQCLAQQDGAFNNFYPALEAYFIN
jgi:hypothetical protein